MGEKEGRHGIGTGKKQRRQTQERDPARPTVLAHDSTLVPAGLSPFIPWPGSLPGAPACHRGPTLPVTEPGLSSEVPHTLGAPTDSPQGLLHTPQVNSPGCGQNCEECMRLFGQPGHGGSKTTAPRFSSHQATPSGTPHGHTIFWKAEGGDEIAHSPARSLRGRQPWARPSLLCVIPTGEQWQYLQQGTEISGSSSTVEAHTKLLVQEI